jgi:hypothetical protein
MPALRKVGNFSNFFFFKSAFAAGFALYIAFFAYSDLFEAAASSSVGAVARSGGGESVSTMVPTFEKVFL